MPQLALSPYKFQVFQKREDIPAHLRVHLITPFDPSLPVKCWIDTAPLTADEADTGARYYRTFKMSGAAYEWAGSVPTLKTIAVPVELLDKFNIAPKDFTGELQEMPAKPEIPCPVITTPPEGYEWFNSMGVVPVFRLISESPVTLEKIYEALVSLREEIRAQRTQTK